VSLKPTNVPLTVKEFDAAKCGVCGGCGCACGYIAYLKGNKLVDLYGHPHNPNGIGSFCTKGITLIQEATQNPLRISKPLKREGENFFVTDFKEVVSWLKENVKGKIGIFLDRLSDLRDYTVAREITGNVYSDSIYLPFRATSLRPQEWAKQKAILALECELVFSEVMSTRWLVDAFEKSAYILSVSSRYGTTSAKATERILVKPPFVVRFIEELADILEEREGNYLFEEKVRKLVKMFSLIKESLILVGDTLLRSKWRGNILSALRRIRKRLRVNYTVVGNISPFEVKEIPEFINDLKELDTLILFGNPAVYMSDKDLDVLKSKKVLHFTLFPNLTANSSEIVVPVTLFPEREFINYKNGFGFITFSPPTLPKPEGVVDPADIFQKTLGLKADISSLLSSVGLDEEKIKYEEGADINLPPIEEWDGEPEIKPVEDEGVYILCDNTLVDDIGHWNVWTHDIEKEQFAYMNRKTAVRLGIGEEIEVGDVRLKVKINGNIADDVIFIPNSFEETQPFNPGIRPGRFLRNAGYRIGSYRVK